MSNKIEDPSDRYAAHIASDIAHPIRSIFIGLAGAIFPE
jgi:hypothetical protein